MSNAVWLVRWGHGGDHAKPEQTVALVLPGKLDIAQVQLIVEQLYVAKTSTPEEMFGYATGGTNPYPAEIHQLASGGYGVVCGHNPWLDARLFQGVSNLKELNQRQGD